MRELYTARLERKILLSAAAQCYHFEFSFESEGPPALEAGQFLSLLADDPVGKTYTRAYSIASPARPQGFDLCVNRVEEGFFSNLLCDLQEGASLRYHGPHGLFTLKRPLANGLMIAAGTGIAPMRGFVQWLFPERGPDRSEGQEYWLIYEAPQPEEFFYNSEFEQVAASHPNFHYLPIIGAEGAHEPFAAAIDRVASLLCARPVPQASPHEGETATTHFAGTFHTYAYVCGLGDMVKAARAQLVTSGWEKRQVLFERYD